MPKLNSHRDKVRQFFADHLTSSRKQKWAIRNERGLYFVGFLSETPIWTSEAKAARTFEHKHAAQSFKNAFIKHAHPLKGDIVEVPSASPEESEAALRLYATPKDTIPQTNKDGSPSALGEGYR